MHVEFILDYRSPYSYLANTQMKNIGAAVVYRPVDIADVMKQVNNRPTPECPAKSRYAAIDAARWAKRYGVAFSPNRALLGAMSEGRFRGTLLTQAALAAQEIGVFDSVSDALFKAMWAGTDDLVTEEGRAAFLAERRIEVCDLWQRAADGMIRDLMAEQSQCAAERGVFGAPTFFVGDEMFFGNDRLEFVRLRLRNEEKSGSGA
jgi:2-hydroxychromene-2-carboxylate isomerase